jgi:NADH-quinone oxidoreductase subunit J
LGGPIHAAHEEVMMSLSVALFAVIAAVTAVSALGVVLAANIVRAAVWLLFTLIGVSMLYLLLGAEFLGATQLIVYVGGTLVLVIFGIMLTGHGPTNTLKTRPAEWCVGGVLGVVLLLFLGNTVWGIIFYPATENALPGTAPLGLGFLGITDASDASYLLPFEIVSMHLLVVLIGAAYLARAKRRKPSEAA